MNYTEALEYIHGVSWTFCKPGLDRIRTLCAALGNPQDSLKFVHVAGTNGKGSFCSMLDSILRAEGYNVGLYTSPYITEFNERMRVGGENISNRELAEITEYVKPIADSMQDKPTEFELITAIAFEFFKRRGCDVVVLEAGMGGRLDSTNIINTSLLSVITGIALDHTAFLGDTVEKIAAEKAGIIKCGVPVLYGGDSESAAEVISARAVECASPMLRPDYTEIKNLKSDLNGSSFDYKERSEIKINLLGLYQPRNASLVIEAVSILNSIGIAVSDRALYKGLFDARWSARFEVLCREPLVIFDGAHNPEGICAAVDSIRYYFGDKRVVAVTGVLADKDYRFIASKLSLVASHAATLTPDNPRALAAEEYARVLSDANVSATPAKSIAEAVSIAIDTAKAMNTAVVCLGSLYTYAEISAAVRNKTAGQA